MEKIAERIRKSVGKNLALHFFNGTFIDFFGGSYRIMPYYHPLNEKAKEKSPNPIRYALGRMSAKPGAKDPPTTQRRSESEYE